MTIKLFKDKDDESGIELLVCLVKHTHMGLILHFASEYWLKSSSVALDMEDWDTQYLPDRIAIIIKNFHSYRIS